MKQSLIDALKLEPTKIVIGASMMNNIIVYKYGQYTLAACNQSGRHIGGNITIWDWRCMRVACVAPVAADIIQAIKDYQALPRNRYLAYTNSEADLIIQQSLS